MSAKNLTKFSIEESDSAASWIVGAKNLWCKTTFINGGGAWIRSQMGRMWEERFLSGSKKIGESQDCPPQDWPHGGQSWGGQSWALSVIRIAHLNYNTIFSLPAWSRVVTIDSGCFEMISTYLIQSASMFNWFIIRFIMDTQIHKKVQLNIFTHWVICLSSIQLWKGKWAGRGLLYKYISVHPA